MLNRDEFYNQIIKCVSKERVFLDEPMSKHTTFKIGGPADLLITPKTVEEISSITKMAQEQSVPLTIIGNGSNLLVLDKGIRGVVVKFDENMGYMRVEEPDFILVGAGALLADVSNFALVQKLTGLEFAIGIPGSIGGAVFMNAGAYDGEISSVIEGVTAVCTDGSIKYYSKDEINFSYRHSAFQENHAIIAEIKLKLVKGKRSQINTKMEDYTMKRQDKQPLEMPSAGSTFKRPKGYYAGTLIEQTGLKGLKVGGAQISEKHAGFVVNADNATAQDVLNLIKEVQKRVYEVHGVLLQPEVRIIGE